MRGGFDLPRDEWPTREEAARDERYARPHVRVIGYGCDDPFCEHYASSHSHPVGRS